VQTILRQKGANHVSNLRGRASSMVIAPRAVLQILLILHGQRLWQVGVYLGMLVSMFMRRHALFSSSKAGNPPSGLLM